MFTGLIESTGTIARIDHKGQDIRLTIASKTLNFVDVRLGDSIATNGICLTVVALDGASYAVDVSRETLSKTAFADYRLGQRVNLEKAMLPTTRFGGHMVSGHIDGVGTLVDLVQDGRSIGVLVRLGADLLPYVARKGSIAIDGISLTVNDIQDDLISLNIIPHTMRHTTIVDWHKNLRVNVEVDLIARYLERLLQGANTTSTDKDVGLRTLLAQSGF